jgi:hypothetical protein
MVNVTCCGNQDRATEASETHPNRPPNDTRNCYTRGNTSPAPFDWNQCGLNDKACQGKGACDACVADETGGYCDYDGSIWVATGPKFTELKGSQIIDRLSSRGDGRTDLRVRRRERDSERKMENRIREMQIMGRDPLPQRTRVISTPVHTQSFIGSYINIIMLGLGILLLISSFVLEYAKKHKLLK